MKQIMKLLPLLLVFTILGCSNAVRSTVSERFGLQRVESIAILPVIKEGGGREKDFDRAAYLLRSMSLERLKSLGYIPLSLEGVDSRQVGGTLASLPPAEAAQETGANGALLIRVTRWDVRRFATYASLDAEAVFELHSAAGDKLWEAAYSIKDSDLSLDPGPLEFSVIKAYEPKVQRLVDAVFSTLPPLEAKQGSKKTYFQWLP